MYFIADFVVTGFTGGILPKNMTFISSVIVFLIVGIPLAILIFLRIRQESNTFAIHKMEEYDTECPEKYNPTEKDMENIKLKLQEYLDTNDERILVDTNFENIETEKKEE